MPKYSLWGLLFVLITERFCISHRIAVHPVASGLIVVKRLGEHDISPQHLRISGNSMETLSIVQCNATPRVAKSEGIAGEGIFGIYNLPMGPTLVIIQSSSECKYIHGVRQIQNLCFIPIGELSRNESTESAAKANRKTLKLIEDSFSRHSLYFGVEGYDVTKTLEQNYVENCNRLKNEDQNENCKRYCDLQGRQVQRKSRDTTFYWNFDLLRPFLSSAPCDESWTIPVINGYVKSTRLLRRPAETKRNHRDVNWRKPNSLHLIARRSRFCQGQRYLKRGSDLSGNVANMVELEQIFHRADDDSLFSFVQVRGSVPIFWKQPSKAWRFKPAIQPARHSTMNAWAVGRHFGSLLGRYAASTNADSQSSPPPPCFTLVNLLDKTKSESLLGKSWLAALHQEISRNSVSSGEMDSPPTRGANSLARVYEQSDTLPNRIAASRSLNNRSHISVEYFNGTFSKYSHQSHRPQNISLFGAAFCWFDYHFQFKHCGGIRSLLGLFSSLRSQFSRQDLYCQLSARLTPPKSTSIDNAGVPDSFKILGEENRDVHLNLSDISSRTLLKSQRHIFRTNCADCLDRTNVVQAMLGRWILGNQMNLSSGSLDSMTAFKDEELEKNFRELWSDSGDVLSILYAGTKALKRDVTRSGRRTRVGILRDGFSSANRHYINNFLDRRLQLGVDLILGRNASSLS